MRLINYVIIFFIISLMAACSIVKTTYNNAPALVIWRLDDYFDLSQAQTLALKPSLQRLHNWHRKTQLPNYVTLLQDTQTMLASPQITASQVCDKIDSAKLGISELQVETMPIIIEIAPLLSDRQLIYFQQVQTERAEKWKTDWWQESTKDQLAVRLEKAQDFAEDVYGNLDSAQITLLKQSIAESAYNPAISYAEVKRRQDDAVQILDDLQKPALTAAEKTQRIKAGFTRLQKSPHVDYQTYADNITQQTCTTIANLHASTNAQQKEHAQHWLGNYITQLTALQTK